MAGLNPHPFFLSSPTDTMTVDCFQFSGWNLEMRDLYEMKNLSPVSAVTVLNIF